MVRNCPFELFFEEGTFNFRESNWSTSATEDLPFHHCIWQKKRTMIRDYFLGKIFKKAA